MTVFEIGAFLTGLSALFGYINHDRDLNAPLGDLYQGRGADPDLGGDCAAGLLSR